VWEPAFLKDASWASGGSIELAYSDIKLKDAIQAQDGQTLLDRCAQSADALSCSAITRSASGQVIGISNPLINIGSIKVQTLDLNVVWTSPEWSFGQFAAHWYTTRLLDFTEKVPTASGLTPIKREGTERGSPDQAYPKTKSTMMLDWDRADFGATLTGRYISSVTEELGGGATSKLNSRLYIDAQVRWTPSFVNDDIRIAVGVNNLFDKDPPGCVSCSLNNYDPNTYDVPGQFFYLRIGYRM
jgi:iron complex outermembrane receptor protein